VNRTLARLSTLINELDHLSSFSSPEVEQTISNFCFLRQDIKARLALSMKEKPEIFTPILCCKDSNYLVLIDTTIMKMVSSTKLPPTAFSLILEIVSSDALRAQKITLDAFYQYLESEIAKHFEVFKENLVLASRATPFSMRKMCFLCRVMGEELRKREGKPHPVWEKFERALQGISGQGWVQKVVR
jgi:hypothetical protein